MGQPDRNRSVTRNQPKRSTDEATMDDMPTPPAHAKPVRRDHLLWFVGVIAAFALYDVWGSWTEVGNKSGFSHGTGWTLTVVVEAFAVCALIAWLADAPGSRSRRFAKWSALIVFALSLVGQSASHLTARMPVPPAAVVVFVSVLPVVMLALGAVLIHLRIADRAEAQEVAQESAIAVELTAARAELEAERAALQPLRDDLAAAEAARDEVAAKAEALAQKLAATARKRRPATARKSASATARKPEPVTGSEDGPDETANLDKEALVLQYMAEGLSASKAGIKAGLTDSRGRQIARKLAAAAPKGQDAESSQ